MEEPIDVCKGMAELKVGLLRTDYRDSHLRSKIKRYVEKLYDLDVFVAPEYSFFNDKKPLSKAEFESEVKGLAEKTIGKKTLVIPGTFVWYDEQDNLYNTLPIIQDGCVIMKYDKRQDGGEERIAEKHNKKFQPGKVRGVFELSTSGKKLKVGVGICADRGTLKRENETNLDLQFLVSAGMMLVDGYLALRGGGYALSCNGIPPEVEVLKYIKNGQTETIEPTKVENEELYVYELVLTELTEETLQKNDTERYFWNSIFK